MSGRSLVSYESRLAMYVGLGVFVNWSAWVVMSLDWRNDMFNVVFHLWFVVGLMACCAALAPLRPYLHWVRERNRKLQLTEHGPATTQSPSRGVESGEDRSAAQRSADRDYFVNALAVIGGGLLALMLLFNMVISPMLAKFAAPYVLHFSQEIGGKDSMWGIPQDSGESQAFVADMCTYCLLTCSNVFLVVVCPFYVRDTGLIGWALLLNTYAHRILFYRGSNERPFHGLDLMMLAMTCYYLGLKHRQKLGEYVIRYWFAIIFLCALLWPPSVMERLDEHPPHDAGVRARFALLEFVYVTAFLVAGERLVQPEIFTQDKMDFLNEWALLIFLIHKAVHIILAPPFNWLFLVCTIPAVYVARRGLPV
ncbi:unnamed protein product [Polarella glacialis]|nr:unnamed protein product [Polarella glacialis]CAE8612383.1 unnamed protein product [Polarella glacialis]